MNQLIKYTVSLISFISILGSGRILANSTVSEISDNSKLEQEQNLIYKRQSDQILVNFPKTLEQQSSRAAGVSEKKGGGTSKQTPRRGDAETRRIKIPTKISLTRAAGEKNNGIIKDALKADLISLEQQAQQLYETGRTAEAVNLLQQVISNYRKQGDLIGQVIALSNLTLVYQQLGDWQQAQQTISDALNLLPEITDTKERQRLLAQTLDAQGQLKLSLGKPEQALDIWKQATDTYQEIGDVTGFTKSKIYQAQALQALGLYSKAIKTLTTIEEQLESEPNTLLKAKALGSIGDVLRRVGKYKESQEALDESLAIAKELQSSQAMADTLLSLGNTARLKEETTQALEFYQRALEASPLVDTQLQAQLNQLNLLVTQKQWQQAMALVPEIESNLTQLPPSQNSISGQIYLAKSLMKVNSDSSLISINHKQSTKNNQQTKIAKHLATAIQQAQEIGHQRGEAEAMGNLGRLYEQHQRLDEAQKLTQRALVISQAINAGDLAYQWQWQLGRILKTQGERQGAIATYTQAVKTLQSLRSDLVAISSELQFSFRESVEPVYRELVELLLQSPQQGEISQDNLKQAREVIESLQLAELDNFFRDACLDTQPVQIDELDSTAAILYTIILGNRLEVIAALPGQPLRHYTTNLSQQEIENNIVLARGVITDFRRIPRLRVLQQFYQWLITPIEANLAASNIKTLVFVPDGLLRNLPPAILHDGEQYLLEKYSVAIAPSLQLVDPQPLTREKLKALTAGLSKAREGFEALPNVEVELERIEAEVSSQVLLNESFTESNFNTAAKTTPYPVIHLATHGEFSSQAEDTYLLAWDGRINIDELNSLIRTDLKQTRPIELLVLSACKTASGDKRAALGLAGIAVRAGARSTIASMWRVSDEATSLLMANFYQELANSDLTKAEALRRAQLSILQSDKFSHPYYWSAFILIGNWL
ncbi:MAG: CHAT domain-containing protein [Symploca sp. SIO2E9]|nr:CHAT domain-containing protein [Symploca sp. SIO2E9]